MVTVIAALSLEMAAWNVCACAREALHEECWWWVCLATVTRPLRHVSRPNEDLWATFGSLRGSWGSYLAARIMVQCDIKCDMRWEWCLWYMSGRKELNLYGCLKRTDSESTWSAAEAAWQGSCLCRWHIIKIELYMRSANFQCGCCHVHKCHLAQEHGYLTVKAVWKPWPGVSRKIAWESVEGKGKKENIQWNKYANCLATSTIKVHIGSLWCAWQTIFTLVISRMH